MHFLKNWGNERNLFVFVFASLWPTWSMTFFNRKCLISFRFPVSWLDHVLLWVSRQRSIFDLLREWLHASTVFLCLIFIAAIRETSAERKVMRAGALFSGKETRVFRFIIIEKKWKCSKKRSRIQVDFSPTIFMFFFKKIRVVRSIYG